MTLEPTPQLRFVEREQRIEYYTIEDGCTSRMEWVRILQQWWRDVQTGEGEWRDVPLEAE